MTSSCPEFEARLESTSARRRFDEHAARCASCREQQEADSELQALFDDASAPHLSPHFGSDLRLRLAAELPASARRRLLVLRAYWLAVAAASVLLLLRVQGPQLQDGAAWWAGPFVLITCLALPSILLSRGLGLGFIDLIACMLLPTRTSEVGKIQSVVFRRSES